MSTTANGHYPIRVLNNDDRRGDRPVADHRVSELTGYRLARFDAEVLAPERETAPADLRLRRIISSYVTLAITDPGIMPLLSARHRSPDGDALSPAVRNSIDRFVRTLETDLAEVIQTQGLSIDPGVAAQSLLGIIHWGITSHRAERRLSRDEAAAQITFLALHGLVSQPAPRPEPTVRPLAQPRLLRSGCATRLHPWV